MSRVTALVIFFTLLVMQPALAYNPVDRRRPLSASQILTQSQSSISIESVDEIKAKPIYTAEFDDKIARYFKTSDCQEILAKTSSHEYETVAAGKLARIAACEPPGKDPDKMFTFAAKSAPNDDVILLLHARYLLKRQSPKSGEAFLQLFQATHDRYLQELVLPFLPIRLEAPRKHGDVDYIVTAQAGGLEEANPRGVSISDPSFGSDVSTAGEALLAGSLHRRFGGAQVGANYVIEDTTYWKTHDADFLTQDIDLPVDWKTQERSETLASHLYGLRPFGSFYMLNGARAYAVGGLGVTHSTSDSSSDQWMQVGGYQENFWPNATFSSHARADWQASFKNFPFLNPALSAYVDYARGGSQKVFLPGSTTSSYLPFSHTEYGLAASLSKVVHRYAVGLSFRAAFRQDSDQSVLIDAFGNSTAKARADFQLVIRPNLTIPLVKGIDLYMFFESNSIGSNMSASDGLDRNISDNLIAALLRASFSNF